MKKVFFLLLVLLAFGNIHAQNWNNINSNKPSAPQVKLISSSEEQIVVNFHFDGFFTDDTQRKTDGCFRSQDGLYA